MVHLYTVYAAAAIFFFIVLLRFTEALTNHEPRPAFRPFGLMTALTTLAVFMPNYFGTLTHSLAVGPTAPGSMANVFVATVLVLATCATGSWLARIFGRTLRPRELA